MSDTNPLNNSTIKVQTYGNSSSGTKIVTTSGGSMDKNAFLKILSAELANLDPTQNQDSTAYVTQMAQFSQVEQMSNLSDTMTKSSYNDLLGKGVVLTDTDANGNNYSGTVKIVTTDTSGKTMLGVQVEENGTFVEKNFSADDITAVSDSSDSTNNAISSTALNTDFLTASALKGKNAVVSTTDSSGNSQQVSGTVESVYMDSGKVMIRITKEDGTTAEYPYSSIVQAGDLNSSTTTSSGTTPSTSAATTGSTSTSTSTTTNTVSTSTGTNSTTTV
jgi:flagellar basal-body rod modification protein FlgD